MVWQTQCTKESGASCKSFSVWCLQSIFLFSLWIEELIYKYLIWKPMVNAKINAWNQFHPILRHLHPLLAVPISSSTYMSHLISYPQPHNKVWENNCNSTSTPVRSSLPRRVLRNRHNFYFNPMTESGGPAFWKPVYWSPGFQVVAKFPSGFYAAPHISGTYFVILSLW